MLKEMRLGGTVLGPEETISSRTKFWTEDLRFYVRHDKSGIEVCRIVTG